MKKNFIISVLCFFAVMCALMCVGCAEKQQTAPGPVMTEVYDDGMYTVDAGRVRTVTGADGSLIHIVRLHIANRTDEPLVISTLLGAYVECGGERINCVPLCPQISSGADLPDCIDGIVGPGSFVDGRAAFPACGGNDGPLTMSLAVDYCADEWITFELPDTISDQ